MNVTSQQIEDIFAASNSRGRAGRIHKLVTTALAEGTFSYSGLLEVGEPLWTQTLQALDGHSTGASGAVVVGILDPVELPALLLVAAEPTATIRHPAFDQAPVVGKTTTERVKIWRDLGPWAVVSDTWPARLARQIIVRNAWPLRRPQLATVVEFRWLVERAARGEEAGHGVREKLAEILARPGFIEFLATHEPDLAEKLAPSTHTKPKRS